jgi:uncharacterized glyoxalase superfamily protein PhnB
MELAPLAVELFVPSVAEAVRFYEGTFDFQTLRTDPPGSTPVFAIGTLAGAALMFMDERYLHRAEGDAAEPRGQGLDIRIIVDSVDDMHARCREAGLTLLNPVGDREYGLRDFIVCDPWGFRLRFASPLRSLNP